MPNAASPQIFTIFHRTKVGIMDGDRNRIGSEVRENRYTIPGKDADTACEDLISNLAEDDDRMEDLTPDDDEWETLLSCAIDDVTGEFLVYAGDLAARPTSAPLYEEGEIGDPTHWEIRRTVTA